ncbi:MAG: hypothetical protein BWY71_01386 [Planctomycetes bacterium ADurb.Bin412]|nr:MAG: hypothetical protein BWY71_01386 [Planctomycetes bacterium ADurb.Bin412]
MTTEDAAGTDKGAAAHTADPPAQLRAALLDDAIFYRRPGILTENPAADGKRRIRRPGSHRIKRRQFRTGDESVPDGKTAQDRIPSLRLMKVKAPMAGRPHPAVIQTVYNGFSRPHQTAERNGLSAKVQVPVPAPAIAAGGHFHDLPRRCRINRLLNGRIIIGDPDIRRR